nr:hypothetical protein CFP56_71318 [Quercus suber]
MLIRHIRTTGACQVMKFADSSHTTDALPRMAVTAVSDISVSALRLRRPWCAPYSFVASFLALVERAATKSS